MSNIQISLQCCTCDEEIFCEVNRPPQFGFELYQIAKDVGWTPIIDYSRVCVFCSEECYKKQLRKNGELRKRFVKIKKEEI